MPVDSRRCRGAPCGRPVHGRRLPIRSWTAGAQAGATTRVAPTAPILEGEQGRTNRALPQRIVLQQKTTLYAVDGFRIGTSSLRKGELFHARSTQQPWEAVVSFNTARLVIKSVVLVALFGELFLDGPGPGPNGRIFDRHGIFERGRRGPRPALDEMQVLARALKVSLRAEVRHVDDKGVALPVAA